MLHTSVGTHKAKHLFIPRMTISSWCYTRLTMLLIKRGGERRKTVLLHLVSYEIGIEIEIGRGMASHECGKRLVR